MGKVIVVRCPMCGWSKRHKSSTPLSEYFKGLVDGDIVLIEEVGGKYGGEGKMGKGRARGRIAVVRTGRLGSLNPKLKAEIRERARLILERL